MKKILLLLVVLVSSVTFAQNNGITYQAVIYSTTGESVPGIKNSNAPLSNKAICLQFSIVDDNSSTEYQEKMTVTTDDYGMVNLVIGNGTQTGGYANSFNAVVWSNPNKYLKVSVDQTGNCSSFELISDQILTYVPFALAANSAASVSGVVGIANGGTNATTVIGAKTNLQLQNVDNTSDLNKPLSTATQTALNTKVDKVTGKELSSNDYTTAEKTKLAAITGTNTGDQDLSLLASTASVALKANTADVVTGLATKVDKVTGKDLSTNDYTTVEKNKLAAISGVNTGDQDLSSFATTTTVALKANTADVTSDLANKVDKVTGKELSSNDYTTVEKNKLAAITGTNTGDQDLSLYATTTSVTLKANSADVTTGLATKVDKVTGKELSSNDYTTVEKNKLTAITGTNTGDQDLSSFATTTSVALKANSADVTIGLATKVDKVTGKELSSNDYTTVEKTKLAAITGTNTGDQDLSLYASTASVALKANTADVTSDLANKVDKVTGKELSSNDYTTVEKTKLAAITGTNTGDQDLSLYATTTSVALKANTADVTSDLANKVDKVTGKELSSNDYTTDEKTKLAAISGVNTGDQDLSSFVPFNGAVNSVNLGNKNLTASYLYGGRINDLNIGIKGTGETNYLGSSALAFSSGGFANTAIGHYTLTETQGDENTAIGAQAMRSSTTGSLNTALGRASLNGNLSGSKNTALGAYTRVLSSNLTNTTAIGYGAIANASNTIQLGNTDIIGINTSGKLTTGTITLPNTDGTSGQVLTTNGSGVVAWSTPSTVNTSNLVDLTTNQSIAGNKIFTSTSIGLQLNTDSYGAKVMKVGFPNNGGNNRNSYKSLTLGVDALKSLLYGDNEIAIGYNALYNDVRGTENIAIGNYSLFTTNYDNITNSWAQNNVVMGNYSGYNMTSGKHNVLMGWQSGYTLNRGSNNTIIGPNASGLGIETGNNNTIIGRALNLPTDLTNNIILANGNTTIGAQFDGTNWTMSGNIKAIGFKTPTGTASGFLKADGSVDTNSYLTSSTANTNLVDLTTNQTIAGNKTLSGITTLSNTTASTSTSNGALIVTGGTGIGGKLNVGGITTVSNSTASTSTTSGAFVVAGGAGIAGNVNVGGNETISGSLGIGTSSVNSSAALEVNSTTQGILFPRVTLAQRDLIAFPAKGLVVMCTDCGQTGGELGELQVFNGSRWTNAVGTDASGVSAGINVPAIGSSFQGGKVAYILTPSDPGYESGKVKGIIAATQDLSTSRLRIYNGTYISTIQNGSTAIGSGLNNTNLLYAAYGTSNTTTSPSYLAYNYSIVDGGVTYDDWFIPSKDELYKMYLNKTAIGNFNETATTDSVYWTSNYCNGNSGAGQYVRFSDGYSGCNGTENYYRVRLVRYFTIDGVTSLTADTFNGNLNGNATSATNVSGVVAIANGGTGATTATGAINALLPTQASANGKVLTSDGTNVSWSSPGGNTHYVGESYGGGIVFYTYDNGAHGLIAGVGGNTTYKWSNATTPIAARSTGVLGGKNNSMLILSKMGIEVSTYAAQAANEYSATSNGITFGDWYLPSMDEMCLLKDFCIANSSNILTSGRNYWTSNDDNIRSDGVAWQFVYNGGATVCNDPDHRVQWRSVLNYIVPIRAF